jgi:Flp pilus assembly pilin Flp
VKQISTWVVVAWGAAGGRFRRQEGQTLTEYALIISVLSLGLVASLTFLRNELDTFFSTAIDKF